MTHVKPRSLGAVTVIATVLALGSTPAFAQDASAPVISAPPPPAASAPVEAPAAQATTVTPPAANPAPQISVPDASAPAPAVQQLIATQAPDTASARASAPRTMRQVSHKAASVAETKAAPAKPASRIAEAPSAPKPAAASADTTTPATAAKPLPAAAIPPAGKTLSDRDAFNSGSRVGDAAQPAQDSRSTPMMPGETGLIAGGAVVLLGAAALFGLRRRRKDERYEAMDTTTPVSPAPSADVVNEPALVLEPPVPVAPARTPATVLAAGPVPTGEAREALLRQMVEAEPDAQNPFTSAKARRRRARLILQAREQRELERTQPFDFRTYKRSVQTDGAEAPRSPTPVTV